MACELSKSKYLSTIDISEGVNKHGLTIGKELISPDGKAKFTFNAVPTEEGSTVLLLEKADTSGVLTGNWITHIGFLFTLFDRPVLGMIVVSSRPVKSGDVFSIAEECYYDSDGQQRPGFKPFRTINRDYRTAQAFRQVLRQSGLPLRSKLPEEIDFNRTCQAFLDKVEARDFSTESVLVPREK